MNKSVLESRQGMVLQKAKLLLDTAEREQRALTEGEEKVHTALLAELESIGQRLDRQDSDTAISAAIDQMTGGMATGNGRGAATGGRKVVGASWGAQVLADEAFTQFLKRGGHRTAGAWTSPTVELSAATITEDPASGGALVLPDVQPGIVPVATAPITIANLIAPGTTESNVVQYMKETAFTNAAAPVAEGGTKPESTLTFTAASDPVRKLAHWIPSSEEILDDVAQMRSYIDARLRHGLALTEDDQLLNGNGVAPNLAGILVRPGLAAPIARVDPATNADVILEQIMAIWMTQMLMPTGIVLNPANWKTILQSKNTTGDYYGNGPFQPLTQMTLWGLPVAVTPAIIANTALVGAFRTAAQLFRRGGPRVEASNSHSDFFVKNLVAIRAEQREALAVYRPGAFGTVTGLK